jgi:hypothetical protein
MRQIFLFISMVVIGGGLYLKFIYDVPDSQAQINFFVSWFVIVIGVGSLLVNIFWKNARDKNKQNKDEL